MPRQLGDLVARGSRSAVHAYGRDAVAKVPDSSTPDAWIELEAGYCASVHGAGAPVPRLLGVEQIGGRAASVWERVRGPSMWDSAVADPARCPEFGVVLAELQLSLFELVPPVSLPRQRDRLAAKIRRSAALVDDSLAEALERLPAARHPPRICHGDLHPANVILGPAGPVVVDWFDVSRGDPVADVARSTLLLALVRGQAPGHLPRASDPTLGVLRRAYSEHLRARTTIDDAHLERWLAIEAVARVAEGVAPSELVARWRAFATPTAASAGAGRGGRVDRGA